MTIRALGRARTVVAVTGLMILFGAPDAAGQSVSITPVTTEDFGPVTLDGAGQTRTAAITNFTVTDTSLISTGWNVTVSATPFQRWDGSSYVPGNPFPAGSLQMAELSVDPQDPLGVPPSITTGPYPIDGASIKVASAAPATGSGAFDFTHGGPLTLTVPAAAYAGTYRAEVTVTVSSGP